MTRSRIARGLVASLAAVAGLCVWVAPSPARAAGEFTVSPTSLSFPATFVGATSSIGVTITNASNATLSPNFSGGAPLDAANFGGSQNCAGKTFAPGDTCTFTYEFEPSSPGGHSSSTTIGIDSDNFSISMSGEGLFPFTVSPPTLAFPGTPVGQTSTIPVIITNISNASQSPNFSGGAPIDPTHFGGSQDCAGKTFGPGDTCTFTYEFKPAAAGPWSSTTTIGVDSENFAISMSGTGTDGNATTTSSSTSTSTSTSTTTTTDPNVQTGPADVTTTSSAIPSSTVAGGIEIVPGPLAEGPAQVIAQGVVEFPAGAVGWDHETLDAAGWPVSFTDTSASFVAIDGPDAVLVSIGSASSALLDAGEAFFLPAGSSGSASPMSDGAASAGHRITFVGASGPSAFTPGPARRDVNLIGDTLAPGESLQVISPFPMLVIVIAGDVTTGGGQVLAEGSVLTLPTVSLDNAGTADAVVLVAAVGGPVP
ncbi:choice-of-anchor D domain-containing protein [Desertimonas flava]|uniref:choice-of-anchor D domain-containing protein n=1 Tax=Desertimonas flava TaxID=2064846 RepID=UPI0013C4B40D|nr:choice-of-anchor D domain-containing protein [Desertimonas flava]